MLFTVGKYRHKQLPGVFSVVVLFCCKKKMESPVSHHPDYLQYGITERKHIVACNQRFILYISRQKQIDKLKLIELKQLAMVLKELCGVSNKVTPSNTEVSKHHHDPNDLSEKRLKALKILVCCCLISTIVIVGYGSFYVLSSFERKVYKSQYESIVTQLESVSLISLRSKVLALRSMSSNLANQCPYESSWPNCSMPIDTFLNVSDPIIEMANLRTIAFAPIITPEQVPAFEEFAYDFFEREGHPEFGIRSFGKGVYSKDGDVVYHDVNGSSLGHNRILTPVLQIGNLASNRAAILYNLYSQQARINAIDDMISCFHSASDPQECSTITDIIWLVQDKNNFRPAVLVVHPIAPKYAPDKLMGLVYTVHNWDTIIGYSLPDYVTGLDAVLSRNTEKPYTYRINAGKARLKGEGEGESHGLGDRHERAYDPDKKSFDIPYFKGVSYTLTLYPGDDYVNQFQTELPLYACIISVAVICVTSFIFFVYDFFVNRQKYENELIINTKRLFVRFISHEIRTPMNTVHLGLNLLGAEMSQLVASGNVPPVVAANLTDWLDLIANIGDSSDAAIVVLNDLINYDKISMGLLNIECQMCSFWDIVGEAVKPFMVQARQAGVELKLDMEVHRSSTDVFNLSMEERRRRLQLQVYGDTLKLTQVVRNLVSNAIKFTPESGRVTVRGM
jgi:hypothetical protein